MFKLYVVYYLAGQVVATIGPLPYSDPGTCAARVRAMLEGVNHRAAGEDGWVAGDYTLRCEFHAERPRVRDGRIVE